MRTRKTNKKSDRRPIPGDLWIWSRSPDTDTSLIIIVKDYELFEGFERCSETTKLVITILNSRSGIVHDMIYDMHHSDKPDFWLGKFVKGLTSCR